MTVAALIEILKGCDQDMHIATAATNSIQFGAEAMRVHLLHTYAGQRVLIGDQSRNNLNYPNWYIEEALDGKPALKDEWPRYVRGEGHWDFDPPSELRKASK